MSCRQMITEEQDDESPWVSVTIIYAISSSTDCSCWRSTLYGALYRDERERKTFNFINKYLVVVIISLTICTRRVSTCDNKILKPVFGLHN